jgi:hypothetical protein
VADAARPKTGPAQYEGLGELILPFVPANVNSDRMRTQRVTSDVYHVCDRLQALNSRLRVNITEYTETGQKAFTVVETNVPVFIDGKWEHEDQVVFRTTKLDARVVEHVRYLLQVPAAQRYEEAEKLATKHEEDEHERMMDDLVERVGLPMMRDLRECGFLGAYSKGGDASRGRRSFGRG